MTAVVLDPPTLDAAADPPAAAADAGPPNSTTDRDTGYRYYFHPRTLERFVSVTTALSILDKPGLPPWYGKHAAICAVENLQRMNAATRVPFCDGNLSGECLTCLMCLMREIRTAAERERDAAADLGKRFHNVAEQRALTGRWISFDPDLEPFVQQLDRFIAIHKVRFEAAEVTVLNRRWKYAGTLDVNLVCGWMPPKHRDLIGVPLNGDYKTGKSVYAHAGPQLAGYGNAEVAMLPDGMEWPMPTASKEWALSIQVRPDNFWVRPCPVTPKAFAKFRRVLATWRDYNESDLDLVGRAMTKPRPPKTTAAAPAEAA